MFTMWMFGVLIILLVISVSMGVYFLPSILAFGKKNHLAIFLLNLLLGWTFVGWVICLIWAIIKDEADTQPCPFCAETIKKEAKVCRYCQRELVSPAPHAQNDELVTKGENI